MEFLKNLFENGAIDWETFSNAITSKGYKLADLSKGEYVSKSKYTDDLNSKESQINTLTSQINTRNTDLENLKQQLEGVQDSSGKLTELSDKLASLQSTYTKDTDKLKQQLKKQEFEFAVKEFANGQKFTSQAAKREFIHSMSNKDIKMENGKLIGATDYLDEYKQNNEDSFVKYDPNPKPSFTGPTNPKPKEEKNPFVDAFKFTGVRPENKD